MAAPFVSPCMTTHPGEAHAPEQSLADLRASSYGGGGGDAAGAEPWVNIV